MVATSKNKKEEIVVQSANKKKRMSSQSRQALWVLSIMACLLIGFIGTYYFVQSFNSFKYEGLTFTKDKYGDIPVFTYYYYLHHDTHGTVKYNLYLRIDPRLNTVPVFGKIAYPEKKIVYLSVDPRNLTQCEFTSAGIGTLTSFLLDNNLKLRAASSNESLANETKIYHADCDTHQNNPVILLKYGNETSIRRQENKLCYVLSVSNCEVLDVIEKFELQTIIDAKNNSLPPPPFYSLKNSTSPQ